MAIEVGLIYREVYEKIGGFSGELKRLTILGSLPYIDYDEYYPTFKEVVFGNVNIDDVEYLVDSKGIYALYGAGNECLYVGQSNNLGIRLYQHLNGFTNTHGISQSISTVEIALCYDDFLREIYETVAINQLRPIYNRSKVFYKAKEVA